VRHEHFSKPRLAPIKIVGTLSHERLANCQQIRAANSAEFHIIGLV
jgi:hypothetical protein